MRLLIGLMFFVMTVLVVPWWSAGATTPRTAWICVSTLAYILTFRVRGSYAAAVFLAFLALYATANPIWQEAWGLWCWFAILTAVFLMARSFDSLLPVAIGAGIGFNVNSAAIVAQYFEWVDLPHITTNAGLYFNSSYACEAAAIVFVLCVGYRCWWLLPGVALTVCAGSRAPLLAVVCAGLLYLLHQRRWFSVAGLALAFGLFGIYRMHMEVFNEGRWTIDTLDIRFAVWWDTLTHLSVFGHGLGSFIVRSPADLTHINALVLRFTHPHNDYLQLLYEFGAFGALMIGFVFSLLWRATTRDAAWYAFVVLLVEAFFAFPLYDPVGGALAAICAGYLFRDWVRVQRPLARRRMEFEPG